MIKLLINLFIPNSNMTDDPDVRGKYGVLGGITGIICNGFLFILKLFIGMTSGSIAIISDGFNNLSDMGSSAVSVLGSRLSARRPDLDHPYGHGRAEYISSLIVSIFIIFVAFELFKSSVGDIINPRRITVSILTYILLIISILIKLWMWKSNRYMGKKINSPLLMATAKDSLNDVIATSAVVISAAISPYTNLPIDGIMGVVVSCFILYTGYSVAKETIDKLLGQNAEEKLKNEIEKALLENENILGMHGLMVHDYGAGRKIASVHAEVPKDMLLIEAHDIIDNIEHRILAELNVDIVIHIDPI